MSSHTPISESKPQGLDDFVKFILNQIEGDAHVSKELLDLGTKTTLSQIVESITVDPFGFKINSLKRDHRDLVQNVNLYFIAYLKSKDKLIEKVFKFDTLTGINYFIVLNDDNTENREVFFQLLDQYENLKINGILPINLAFLPKEAIPMIELEEVSLL